MTSTMSSGMGSRNRPVDDIYYQLVCHKSDRYKKSADYQLMTQLWTRVVYELGIGFDWRASMAAEDIHDCSQHMVCIHLIEFPIFQEKKIRIFSSVIVSAIGIRTQILNIKY